MPVRRQREGFGSRPQRDRRPAPDGTFVAGLAAILLLLAACTASGGSTRPVPGGPSASPSSAIAPASATAGATNVATPAPESIAWSPIQASGPAAREDHTWTVHQGSATAYLFGGRDGTTVFADVWAYDLETDAWAELNAPGAPPARFGHEAAWVDGVGLVVFAGQAGSMFFNDLWAFDPVAEAWSQLPSGGAVPVARYGSCSTVGADGRLWISHGFTSDGTRFGDTRAYDFDAGTWSDETPSGGRPVERCLHACWLTDAGAMVLYAGQTTGVVALADRWTLGDDGWQSTSGSQPPARNLPAHVRLDGATLVFGGMALDASFHADLWVLDDTEPDAVRLEPSGPGPTGRSGAALARDPDGGRVLLFGGRSADGASAETWELTGLGDR